MQQKFTDARLRLALSTIAIAAALAPPAHALTPDEIKQLGTTLTPWGAEIAGNKEGTIPAYTGGLSKAPAGVGADAALLPDPYATEKPLLTIDAKNLAQYADKLTDGARSLFKRFPDYRMNVYPSHRSFPEMPKRMAAAAIKNATNPECALAGNGVGIRGCWGGTPFPIPRNGLEVMWNHNLRWRAVTEYSAESWVVNGAGESLLNQSEAYSEFPYFTEGMAPYGGTGQFYMRFINYSTGPARDVGNVTMAYYPLEFDRQDQRIWSYSPGQRRVRLAPEFAYDTPSSQMGGAMNYDEIGLFSGRMDRYEFKLLGKKEKYTSQNSYNFLFNTSKAALLGKQHLTPEATRWELRRVWVVEATLKPGIRHSMPRRVFYVDEDSWTIVAAEGYDAANTLVRVQDAYTAPHYTSGTFITNSVFSSYDLVKGQYAAVNMMGTIKGGYLKTLPGPRPERTMTPESMAASAAR
ncbi:MAG: DUF1329 domain-containing protein [Pseudomonadota bacterium]